MKNKTLQTLLIVGEVLAGAWYLLVVSRRPSNYAAMTPAQQAEYDRQLLAASGINGSVFE